MHNYPQEVRRGEYWGSDKGCYQCRAQNWEGYATTTAYLVVRGEYFILLPTGSEGRGVLGVQMRVAISVGPPPPLTL